MIMGHWWIDNDRGNPKYLEENLSQCHLVLRKYHNDLMTGLEYNSGVCFADDIGRATARRLRNIAILKFFTNVK
jgi:hypothetical protein